jgi:alanine racemase
MSVFAERPTFAEINLENLRFNFRSSRDFIGQDVKYMAVVKANAYGHGAVECSRALIEEGVDWLGVALLEEAIQLRESGIHAPILCLGGLFADQAGSFLDHNITPTVVNIAQANSLNTVGRENGVKVRFHLKIDTGMGRLGVRWDELNDAIPYLTRFTHLKLDGVMSHFASANDSRQNDFTSLQIDRLTASVAKLEASGLKPEIVDIANSPGAVGHPRSRSQMVRLGGILYGLGGDVLNKDLEKPELRPVLSLCSEIADIKNISKGETVGYGRTFTTLRESRIALVPIGYNDGYRRSLSNKASVLINGVVAPVAGRISMDWTIIDVTDISDAKIGDRVTVIGRSGNQAIAAEDLAGIADTISYEITCGISTRVPRRFVE